MVVRVTALVGDSEKLKLTCLGLGALITGEKASYEWMLDEDTASLEITSEKVEQQ